MMVESGVAATGFPLDQADPFVLQATNRTETDPGTPLYHLLARTNESHVDASLFFRFASRSTRDECSLSR